MPELLTEQKKIIDLLKKSPLKDKFYWTGGTLLSTVYLQHRLSKDLDFFSDKKFYYDQLAGFIKEIKTKLNLPEIEEKRIHDRYEFFFHNGKELRIEFVYYPYPKIKPRKKWQGILIDSLDDIAANKTMAYFDRNDPKDLFDIYFLMAKKGYTPKILLKMVKKKFEVQFSESSFWSEAYKAFNNLENLIPLLLIKDSKSQTKIIDKIKKYYKDRSTAYLNRLIK